MANHPVPAWRGNLCSRRLRSSQWCTASTNWKSRQAWWGWRSQPASTPSSILSAGWMSPAPTPRWLGRRPRSPASFCSSWVGGGGLVSTDERAADCFRTFRRGGVCGQVIKYPKQNICEDPGVSWHASVWWWAGTPCGMRGLELCWWMEMSRGKAFENTYLKKSKNSSRYDGADGDLHAYDEQQNLWADCTDSLWIVIYWTTAEPRVLFVLTHGNSCYFRGIGRCHCQHQLWLTNPVKKRHSDEEWFSSSLIC